MDNKPTHCNGWAWPDSEGPLGRGDAGAARVRLDGLAQSAGGRLEDALDDVVRVAAVVQDDVQGQGPAGRNRPPELLGQLGIEGPQGLQRHLRAPDAEGPA